MAFSAFIALTLASTSTVDLPKFEAMLARHDSATAALEQWCERRGIADPPIVRARRIGATSNDPPRSMRRRLNVARGEQIALRHVRLACGTTVLSVAWNWYVPARLTPTMRETLRTTDTPFGKVVARLSFRREALATIAGRAENCPRGTISTHRARLILPDGKPLAYVIECYTAANLGGGQR